MNSRGPKKLKSHDSHATTAVSCSVAIAHSSFGLFEALSVHLRSRCQSLIFKLALD